MNKRENSREKENAQNRIPAGVLSCRGETVFELCLERMGRISVSGDEKERNFT